MPYTGSLVAESMKEDITAFSFSSPSLCSREGVMLFCVSSQQNATFYTEKLLFLAKSTTLFVTYTHRKSMYVTILGSYFHSCHGMFRCLPLFPDLAYWLRCGKSGHLHVCPGGRRLSSNIVGTGREKSLFFCLIASLFPI